MINHAIKICFGSISIAIQPIINNVGLATVCVYIIVKSKLTSHNISVFYYIVNYFLSNDIIILLYYIQIPKTISERLKPHGPYIRLVLP